MLRRYEEPSRMYLESGDKTMKTAKTSPMLAFCKKLFNAPTYKRCREVREFGAEALIAYLLREVVKELPQGFPTVDNEFAASRADWSCVRR